jgi:hydroxyacyl-ACP dehydratase HTD2-like protein with hotdog domain
MSRASPLRLELLRAGAALPPLRKPRLTSTHLVRWCAAQQNWARIHFDDSYARSIAKLPGVLINGALKQHLLAQFLTEAFDGTGWVWRIDYDFTGMDLVGQLLEVRGRVTTVCKLDERMLVLVDIEIHNMDLDRATTLGKAVVALRNDGEPITHAIGQSLPDDLRLNGRIDGSDETVPHRIRSCLGAELDRVESDYPLDLSRLRLFADAIMGLRPVHFDARAAESSVYGVVVAPPLFPLHGLELYPDTCTLSEETEASGREGVAELPRNLAARFGIKPAGSINGGSSMEVHSLLRVGERVAASSTLAGAKLRRGKTGNAMLIFHTINRFSEARGRPLLTERHASIYRIDEDQLNVVAGGG